MVENIEILDSSVSTVEGRVGNNPLCPPLGKPVNLQEMPYDIAVQWKGLKVVADMVQFYKGLSAEPSGEFHGLIGDVRTFDQLEEVVAETCSIGGEAGDEAVLALKSRMAQVVQPELSKMPPGRNFAAIELVLKWANESRVAATQVETKPRVEEIATLLVPSETLQRPASVSFVEDCAVELYPDSRSRGKIYAALKGIVSVDDAGFALQRAVGLGGARNITEHVREVALERLTSNHGDKVAKRDLKWSGEEMARIEEAERLEEQRRRLAELKDNQREPWSRKTKSGLPRGIESYSKKKRRGPQAS